MTAKTFGKRGVTTPAAPVRFQPRSTQADVASSSPPSDDESVAAHEFATGKSLASFIPLLTLGLIAVLAAIFTLQTRLAPDIGAKNAMSIDSLLALGASSYNLSITHGEIWRLFLAPWLHSDNSHRLGTCIALVFVGMRLEPWVGRGWYAAIYILSGLGGEIGSLIGSDPNIPGVGASGAISGLVGALFAMCFCKGDQLEFDTRSTMKTVLLFGGPALAPLLWGGGGNVNYWAHLGGAVTGFVLGLVVGFLFARTNQTPTFSKPAAWLAAGGLLLSSTSAGFAATHFDEHAARAHEMVPLRALPDGTKSFTPQTYEMLGRYPNDPRAHLIRGIYQLSVARKIMEGESEIRLAIAQAESGGGHLLPIATRAKGLLALVMLAKGQTKDARATAAPQCGSKDKFVRDVLTKSKLCD